MSTNSAPLPYGWITQIDPTTNHPFFVDTKATPPRSIWVHPYEDEQYLKEHPDVREKVGRDKPSNDLKPPVDDSRRHSYGGESSKKVDNEPSRPGSASGQAKPRSFMGKLKDKAIGTKEEREAAKQRAALVIDVCHIPPFDFKFLSCSNGSVEKKNVYDSCSCSNKRMRSSRHSMLRVILVVRHRPTATVTLTGKWDAGVEVSEAGEWLCH
jgi:hypothetical protein